MERNARRSGFTLIELLIVVAIIGILSAILIPVAGRMQEKARKDECLNNLRQWGVGLLSYLDEHRGKFPGYGSKLDDKNAWFNQLPPYLGVDPLMNMTKTPRPGNGVKSVFICSSEKEDPSLPQDGRVYYSSYAFNTFIGQETGILFSRLNLKHEPPIHPASFVVMAETGNGTTPGVNLSTIDASAFRHSHSMNVCFADGHAENALQIQIWRPGLAATDNYGGLQWNPDNGDLEGPGK